jgi:hypothetical protein
MSGNKQSIKLTVKHKSHTIIFLISTASQYHHYSPRHDDLDQYGTTTSSKLCSQKNMFLGATSFDQPLLYCNWQSKNSIFKDTAGACDGTVTCGWGNETSCPTTANPTATPTANPTATPTANPTATPTANPTNSTVLPDADTPGAGGGKAAI